MAKQKINSSMASQPQRIMIYLKLHAPSTYFGVKMIKLVLSLLFVLKKKFFKKIFPSYRSLIKRYV